eukprot:6850791-Pyramimonas_sp.AAC.1
MTDNSSHWIMTWEGLQLCNVITSISNPVLALKERVGRSMALYSGWELWMHLIREGWTAKLKTKDVAIIPYKPDDAPKEFWIQRGAVPHRFYLLALATATLLCPRFDEARENGILHLKQMSYYAKFFEKGIVHGKRRRKRRRVAGPGILADGDEAAWPGRLNDCRERVEQFKAPHLHLDSLM